MSPGGPRWCKMEAMLVGPMQFQPLSMGFSRKHLLFLEIMDHALNWKTPSFSMKLPTSTASIFAPARRTRGYESLSQRQRFSILFFNHMDDLLLLDEDKTWLLCWLAINSKHRSLGKLGQCKARPFIFVLVCFFLFFIFCFSALTDYGFNPLHRHLHRSIQQRRTGPHE